MEYKPTKHNVVNNNFTEHVATIQEPDYSSTRSSVQDTTSQLSKLMPRHMSRSAINVNDSIMSLDSHQSISP